MLRYIEALVVIGAAVLLAVGEEGSVDEQKAIDALTKLGSKITRDENAPGKPVVGADLRGCVAHDSDLARLQACSELVTLNLGGTGVTDGGLKKLAALKALQMLDLTGCRKVTDVGLKQLAALQALKEVHLGGTSVTGSGLKELTTLKDLETLS